MAQNAKTQKAQLKRGKAATLNKMFFLILRKFVSLLPLKTTTFANLPRAILLTAFFFITRTFIAVFTLFMLFITVFFIVEILRPMVEGSLTSRSPPKQIHNQIRKP